MILRLRIAARVTEQADDFEVIENRLTQTAATFDGLRDVTKRVEKIEAVALNVMESVPATEQRLDPRSRRLDANADPVVLAHEKNRNGQVHVCGASGCVEGGLGDCVVDRSVAERTHND